MGISKIEAEVCRWKRRGGKCERGRRGDFEPQCGSGREVRDLHTTSTTVLSTNTLASHLHAGAGRSTLCTHQTGPCRQLLLVRCSSNLPQSIRAMSDETSLHCVVFAVSTLLDRVRRPTHTLRRIHGCEQCREQWLRACSTTCKSRTIASSDGNASYATYLSSGVLSDHAATPLTYFCSLPAPMGF